MSITADLALSYRRSLLCEAFCPSNNSSDLSTYPRSLKPWSIGEDDGAWHGVYLQTKPNNRLAPQTATTIPAIKSHMVPWR